MKVALGGKKLIFLLLGFNAIIIQLVILRELFSIFSGNELLTGVVMSCWFVITGLGAILAKFVKSRLTSQYFFVLLTMPIVLTALLLLTFTAYKNLLFQPGAMQGPFELFLIIAAILFPVCMLSGAAFTLFVAGFSDKNNNVARCYALESLGSIAGGALFSFVLIHLFNSYEILSVVAAINALASLMLLSLSHQKIILILQVLLLIAMVVVLTFTGIEDHAIGKLFPGQSVVETVENEYGKLTITQASGQYNLFDNGALINTGHNEMAVEEAVHYAMIQRPQATMVLQIGGNIAVAEKEIRKYPVGQIDFVDINKDVTRLEHKYFSALPVSGITEYHTDPRIFINKTSHRYDVVLINTPEPMYAQTNRYYTLEFFYMLKRILHTNGVISLSLPGVENYMNTESTRLNSSIFQTLKKVFSYVEIIPGNKLFFIASDGQLTSEIVSAVCRYKISNVYVNEYYLDDATIKHKAALILSKIKADALINHDFKPITYYYGLQFWLSHYQISLLWPLIILSLVLLLFFIFLKPVNISLLAGGFTASAVEMLIIVAFQALYGYVYAQLGLIFTLFMAGLFTGSFLLSKLTKARYVHFIFLQFSLLIFLAVLWVVLNYMLHFSVALRYLMYFFMFLQACITGMQFAVATKLKDQSAAIIAGNSYGIELFGSAGGALLITSLCIPLLGISTTLIALGLFNACALIIMVINKRLFGRLA
ncbi:MAG TPA: fused MFS/spermidine synthase [Bacteroidales bacterium]|nr:fused MFS/spermidine synthase [Bacteroidales bacterium]